MSYTGPVVRGDAGIEAGGRLDRPRRWRARVVRAAAIVVLAAAAAAVVVVPTGDADVATGVIRDHHPYCEALREPAWGRTEDGSAIDAVVFIDGFADASTVSMIEEEIRSDAAVTSAVLFSQEDAYEEFRSQFADDPLTLDSIEADILPPSVRVALDPQVAADPDEWAATWEDHQDVLHVATSATVLRHGPLVADVLLGPFLEAHPGDIVSLHPSRFEDLLEAAPDGLVRDLIALEVVVVRGAIFGSEEVRIRPATVEAAHRVLDHAVEVCGVERPQAAGPNAVGL